MSVVEFDLVLGRSHYLCLPPGNAITNFKEARSFLVERESREALAVLNIYPEDGLFFAYWRSKLVTRTVVQRAQNCVQCYCEKYQKGGIPILGFKKRAALSECLYPEVSDQYELLVKPLINNSWECLSRCVGKEEGSYYLNSPAGIFMAIRGDIGQGYAGIISSISDTEGFARFMRDTVNFGMEVTTKEARQFFEVSLSHLNL